MYKKHTLENGLRIIEIPEADSPTITLLVLVEAGSKYETKDINGISHFLEHMIFKGTKKRPTPFDIAAPIDSVGGGFNAFTGQEYTGYYIKVEKRYFDLALDVLSDIFLNSIFPKEEIEKERGVIVAEINMYLDMPQRYVGELWHEVLYGDQPAGWDVAGKKEVIKNVQRDDFLKYLHEHYLAPGTLVVVSGGFGMGDKLAKIKKAFSPIKNNSPRGKISVIENQNQPKSLLFYKKTDQTHLILGGRAYSFFDKRVYAQDVLSAILGGGMSSRLFQVIREEMGAAYYVRSDSENFTDHGYLAAAAGVHNERVIDVLKVILKEFKKIKDFSISPKELKKAKDFIKGGLALSLERSNDKAFFCGMQEILKRKILTPKEIFKAIDAVRVSDIKAIASDIFRGDKLNLALIGPFKDKKPFEKILNI